MALPAKHRLTARKDIDRVFKSGKTGGGGFFFIRFLKNNLGYCRFGILAPVSVSKKATARNHIKRLISEALKEHTQNNLSLDLAVVASVAIVGKTQKEIKRDLDEAIKKIIVNQ